MAMRYERRRFLAALLTSLAPCLLLTAVVYLLYGLLRLRGGTLMLSYALASLPAPLRRFFAILSPLDMSNPLVFFVRLWQPVLLLENLLVAVTAARGLTCDEDGLFELYFPVGRTRTAIFFTRCFGGLLYVVVLNILLFGAAVGGYCLFAPLTTPYLLTFGVLFMRILLLQLVIFALGTMYSAAMRRTGAAVFLSVLTVVLLWLLGLVPSFIWELDFLWYAALPHYALPEYALSMDLWTPIQMIVLGSLLLLCSLLAFLAYRRREFEGIRS